MHDHGTEKLPPPSGEASVMVDVGGGNGALVVFTTAQLDGAEIEIRRVGRPWEGTHTAIRRRDLPEHVAFAGVFGTLPAGDYELRILGPRPGSDADGPATDDTDLRLTVRDGEVTQAEWPTRPVGAGDPVPTGVTSSGTGP